MSSYGELLLPEGRPLIRAVVCAHVATTEKKRCVDASRDGFDKIGRDADEEASPFSLPATLR